MSPTQQLLAADRQTQPWKDGGGWTDEIAVSPREAGLADFDWRVSMATIATLGAFSRFGGVDRTLAVVEGRLELVFDGADRPLLLDVYSDPHRFSGEIAVTGSPVGAAVTGLNLMTRRGRCCGSIERVAPRRPTVIPPFEGVILFKGKGAIRRQGKTIGIGPFDAVHIVAAASENIEINTSSDAYVVRIER